ncbi:MAG TPA: cytochrome c, partial [Urbifossiella sp.]
TKETLVKAHLRLICGAAGLCLLAAASAAPPVSSETAKAATTADVAELQKKIETIAANPAKSKGAIRTAKGLVLTIGVYGDAATQGQAAKVFLALDKKDYDAAAAAAKGLASPKADAAAVKELDGKFDLEDIMSQFRLAKSGGNNIEKDLRDAIKSGSIEPKAAELIGARSAALAVYTEKMPNDKAKTNPDMTRKWERWAKEMASAGKELAEEATKGKDAKRFVAIMKKLDASCSNCHNDFRNE